MAVKVIDVDSQDYKVPGLAKDDSIDVTLHEIRVLQQLQGAKAKNINPFFEAFQMHSQLWIVSDYCPGGSVRTLVSLTSLLKRFQTFFSLWHSLATFLLRLQQLQNNGI